jgi:hypothetical protein
MFSKMFAFLFLAALSMVADREKRRPSSGEGTERCDWERDDGGVKKGGRNESLPFEWKFSG